MSNFLPGFEPPPLAPFQGGQPLHKPAPAVPPRARRTDPKSSHKAAAKSEQKSAVARVLCEAYVRRYPGCTTKELSEKPGVTLSYHEIARRMKETEELLKSVYRKEQPDGGPLRWYPVE